MVSKTIAIMISAVLVVSCAGVAYILLQEDDSSIGAFYVTDGRGKEIAFNEPAQKAATMGVSFTTTLIALEKLDSIVLMDTYSKTSSSGIPEIASYPDSMFTSSSATNVSVLAQTLLNTDGFNKDRDILIMYNYASMAGSWEILEKTYGLKVAAFYPQSYDAAIEMVSAVGKIMGADEKAEKITEDMNDAKTSYLDALGTTTKKKAMYVSYSSGNYSAGNAASFTAILMGMAGAVNSAEDSSKTGTTYVINAGDILQIESIKGLDIVFVDGYYTGSVADFKSHFGLGASVEVVLLTKLMNQYGPTALDGIEYMANAMYPTVFP